MKTLSRVAALLLAAVLALSCVSALAEGYSIPKNVKQIELPDMPSVPTMKTKNNGVTETITLSEEVDWISAVWNWQWVSIPMDGVTGTILETGEVRMCAECPHNQFVNGHKECSNKKQLYIMREGDLVPILFSLPPTALKFFDKYLVRCRLTMRVPLFSVVTRITLRNENNGGNEYSVPVFTPVGKLPKEEAHRLSLYAQEFAAAAQRSGIQADDLNAEPAGPAEPAFTAVEMPDEELPFDGM